MSVSSLLNIRPSRPSTSATPSSSSIIMSDRTSRVPIPPYELPLLPLTAKEVQNLTALINTRSGISKVSDTLASAITALGNATLELYPDPDEENEEKDKAMADMEKLARELVDENKRALDMKEALESIVNAQRETLRRGDEPRESSEEQGLSGQYESILGAKKRRWDAMNNTEKYTNSPEYLDFRRSYWEARNPEVPLPAPKTWFSSGTSDAQDDESDIEIAQERQSYRCPLTLRPFEDPVRSTVCPHAFEKEAIEDMIKRSPVNGVPCPTPGCAKMLTLRVLKKDSVLKRKVVRALALERRRQQQREDESEDEEAEEEASEEEEAQPGPSSRRGKGRAGLRGIKAEKGAKKFKRSGRPVAVSSEEEEDEEDDADAMDEEEG